MFWSYFPLVKDLQDAIFDTTFVICFIYIYLKTHILIFISALETFNHWLPPSRWWKFHAGVSLNIHSFANIWD